MQCHACAMLHYALMQLSRWLFVQPIAHVHARRVFRYQSKLGLGHRIGFTHKLQVRLSFSCFCWHLHVPALEETMLLDSRSTAQAFSSLASLGLHCFLVQRNAASPGPLHAGFDLLYSVVSRADRVTYEGSLTLPSLPCKCGRSD